MIDKLLIVLVLFSGLARADVTTHIHQDGYTFGSDGSLAIHQDGYTFVRRPAPTYPTYGYPGASSTYGSNGAVVNQYGATTTVTPPSYGYTGDSWNR